MNNGKVLSVKNGNYIGNVPPYGYRKVRIKDGKRYAYTLEPDPIEAPILKAIFTWYADGIGTTHICDKLEEMGVKPRKAKAWSPYSIAGFSTINTISARLFGHTEQQCAPSRTVTSLFDGRGRMTIWCLTGSMSL